MSVKVTKDGRRIRTGKDYTAFRRGLWDRQAGGCDTCGRPTSLSADLISDYSFHVHHKRGRGGGKRDDTLEACVGLCGADHRKVHGQ